MGRPGPARKVSDKSKGGRPPAPPGLRRVNVPLRLPEWLVQWMAAQAETPAELIESALLKAHKLRPHKAMAELQKEAQERREY